MGIEGIINQIRVSDRIASSGQPRENQFVDIARAGYQVVINLAMPDSDDAVPEEGNIVTSQGMIYVHTPVPFDAPTVVHLRTFIKIMQAFADQRVWVHCALNYRVSAFLYQYLRLVQGMPEEEAKKVMFPSWEPDAEWRRFMTYTNKELAL